MSNDSASLNSTPAAIAYLNPMQLPRRPGLLTALGIADFLVAAISIVANVGAILICLSLYRLTLPVPKPAATLGPLPLAPSTPIKPYHGDYLPASGLPKESRSAVIEAAVKSSRLDRDRQAMLNRLLAESGKQILGKQSISETVAFVARSSAGPDMPSPRNPIVFNFPAGKVEINNSNASFTPADGSTETIITGNFVKSGGRTQYCAVAIDETVDAVQRRLNGEMNALQAGALAELYRPDGAGLPPGSPLLTPNVFHVSKVAGVPGCQTIQIKVVALLHSPSLQTRQAAADALAINSAQEKVLTAIRPPLHDQDPAVRAAAAVAWQKPGRQHPDLVPLDDLVNLLEDADPQVRFQGAWAVYRCQDTAPMLGPYSYPLMHAALFEGHKDNRKEGVLTETPVSPTQNTVDKSVPPYPDADPKTGEVIHPPPPATTAVPAPQLLPKLAQSVSVLAWAALIAAIAGLLAKARLAALPQKPA